MLSKLYDSIWQIILISFIVCLMRRLSSSWLTESRITLREDTTATESMVCSCFCDQLGTQKISSYSKDKRNSSDISIIPNHSHCHGIHTKTAVAKLVPKTGSHRRGGVFKSIERGVTYHFEKTLKSNSTMGSMQFHIPSVLLQCRTHQHILLFFYSTSVYQKISNKKNY